MQSAKMRHNFNYHNAAQKEKGREGDRKCEKLSGPEHHFPNSGKSVAGVWSGWHD